MRRGFAGLVLGVWIGGSACALAEDAPIRLQAVVEGLERPVFVTHAGDASGYLYVLEQPGRVRVVIDGALAEAAVLDLTDRVESSGNEQGLLGLAFHPEFEANGRFFVNYTRRPDGATVVSEFEAAEGEPVSAEAERVLLTIEQPYGNHNGGMIAFGPDGYLYIGMGDGGSGGDPQNFAQNPEALLGKMLRIDVDAGDPYGIPDDNPFLDGEARPEIWALGLRNPWRFSFDRETGELYAGDVGQNAIEEISVIERGGNYGWRLMEGTQCYQPPENCRRDDLILPIAEYTNASRRCSVTGGYVYRGEAVPALAGTYLYGDFCSGEIFGLRPGKTLILLDPGISLASFGEDEAGELYVADLGGAVYRIEAAAAGG